MPRKCMTCGDDIIVGKIITELDNGLEEVEILTECLCCRSCINLTQAIKIKKELNKNLTAQRKRVIYLEELLKLRKIKNQWGTYTKYCEERYTNPDNFEDF